MFADPSMSKREERKLRAEAERLEREHMQRARKARARLLFIVGALAVLGMGVLYVTRRSGSGRVWSAAHGHYHDKYGREIR